MADLPYTEASNQQSYQQLLWKTLAFVGASCRSFFISFTVRARNGMHSTAPVFFEV